MTRKKVHAIVSGRVQGVFFRHYTQLKARELGLAGWVRNLADGTVESVFEGESPQIEQMLAWLRVGSPGAQVTGVTVSEEPPTGAHDDFIIRH